MLLAGYHLVYFLAPAYMRESLHAPGGYEEGTAIAVGHTGVHHDPLEDEATGGEIGYDEGAAGTPRPPHRREDGDDGDDRETASLSRLQGSRS